MSGVILSFAAAVAAAVEWNCWPNTIDDDDEELLLLLLLLLLSTSNWMTLRSGDCCCCCCGSSSSTVEEYRMHPLCKQIFSKDHSIRSEVLNDALFSAAAAGGAEGSMEESGHSILFWISLWIMVSTTDDDDDDDEADDDEVVRTVFDDNGVGKTVSRSRNSFNSVALLLP